MRDYELMAILSPELDDEGLQAAIERVKSVLAARGAEVGSIEPWGRRRLAYSIDHKRDGHFALARFQMPPEQTDELERTLRLTDQVIRHLLIRLDSR